MTELRDALNALERLAPLALAGDWDNVGLLLEPIPGPAPVSGILLAIDLSAAVVAEAAHHRCELVVAYHPPIFQGLKRLDRSQPLTGHLLDLARHGIAVYSPHTALDSVAGGVNDWLADAFDGTRSVLQPDPDPGHPGAGQGRRIELDQPQSLATAAATIRTYLGLDAVRLAAAPGHEDAPHPIRSIALCPGAGGSVIGATDADLLWTGEMRHHDILAAAGRGQSVILCEHTNTERGFLPIFAQRLRQALPAVTIHVAACDRDPLRWWQ